MATSMIQALRYKCNKIRTKRVKINPTKVLKMRFNYKVAIEIIYSTLASKLSWKRVP